ncbi:beta-ketoacyl-[acyl-carrier-protein] synthase family protein [Paenibacillus algorifonticola]|uniref:beta-ketoacyl-[acyl-carrier-protein] synthase family protein n=1 Tax=Paenibacillus algorifonticola TaxID=684063 RepID=UPI003D2CA150
MFNRVVITGIGLMIPSGFGEEAVKRSVLAGEHRFRPVTRFDSTPFRTAFAAESDFKGTLLGLGERLAEEAVASSGLQDLSDSSIVLGLQGDYNALQQYWRLKSSGQHSAIPLSEFLPSYHLKVLADLYRLKGNGKKISLNNACIASSNAIGVAYELIRRGQSDTALCGGYSLVTEEMFAKFNSGRTFAADGRVRAFSANRSGMLLGDGGAMLLLESLEHAEKRGATILAEMLGWGLSCDAFHVCQPHPDGAGMALAIERALAAASIQKEEIDYIHAHGTGTPLNDRAETAAIKRAFGTRAYDTPISSTKTVTGHILEGTGAVETALSIMAMKHNTIPPTMGYEEKDPHCDLDYVPNYPRKKQLNKVINLNASFGGNNTAIVLQKSVERG